MRGFAIFQLVAIATSVSCRLTWGATNNLFVFGDSYTTTGWNVSEGIDSPVPGFTSSNGPNWVTFLGGTFNVTTTRVFNLASGGATTDAKLVTPFQPTVLSFVDQVNQFKEFFSPAPALAPWKSSDSLFAIMIGINDVGNSWGWTNVTQHGFHITLLDRYFGQVESLYDHGARAFLFINVPPIDRAPLFLAQGNTTTAAVKASLADYNLQFAQRVAKFKASHRGLQQVTLFDANKVFDVLLDNASPLGFVNATGFCEAYQNGTPSITTQVAGCAPVAQYFWLNSLHPLFSVHNSLAHAIATELSA